jgi:1-acyl-sn-glycerol-3-phosphate acyltransferase
LQASVRSSTPKNVGPGAHIAARLIKLPVEVANRWLLDGVVTGREHLPCDGPYIITANHLSLIDPILVSLAAGRLVRFLALDELFGRSRVLDELMLYFGAVPLSRERPPYGALQQAMRLLEDGQIMGIVPEGARSRYWGERPIKRGAAWLSLATGAPIVPCAVTGTESTLSLAEPRFRIPSVRLSLHPAIEPEPYCDMEDPVGAMMDDWVSVIEAQLGHWVCEE